MAVASWWCLHAEESHSTAEDHCLREGEGGGVGREELEEKNNDAQFVIGCVGALEIDMLAPMVWALGIYANCVLSPV